MKICLLEFCWEIKDKYFTSQNVYVIVPKKASFFKFMYCYEANFEGLSEENYEWTKCSQFLNMTFLGPFLQVIEKWIVKLFVSSEIHESH